MKEDLEQTLDLMSIQSLLISEISYVNSQETTFSTIRSERNLWLISSIPKT